MASQGSGFNLSVLAVWLPWALAFPCEAFDKRLEDLLSEGVHREGGAAG